VATVGASRRLFDRDWPTGQFLKSQSSIARADRTPTKIVEAEEIHGGAAGSGAPACHNHFGRDTPVLGSFCFLRWVPSGYFDEDTWRACSHRSARKGLASPRLTVIAGYCCAVRLGCDTVNTAMQPWASLPPAEEQTVLCAAGMGT
jgi:hypothetical protein